MKKLSIAVLLTLAMASTGAACDTEDCDEGDRARKEVAECGNIFGPTPTPKVSKTPATKTTPAPATTPTKKKAS